MTENRKKITIKTIQNMKKKGEKISFLTAYDYPTAFLEDRAGIEMILIGDSLGMTTLGFKTTLPVTMNDMIRHTEAVCRAVKYAFIVGDMPYMSYQASSEEAIRNAGKLMVCGVDGIKLEGGVKVASIVEKIVNAGIPVMGHIGLTPQSAAMLGGFRVQGKDAESARALIKDAKTLENAGAFAILLECIPAPVGKMITEECSIPILSIGGGPHCDGQLLIVHDMIGLYEVYIPKFVKQYANIGKIMEEAFIKYKEEVKSGVFPGPEHCYEIDDKEMNKLFEG